MKTVKKETNQNLKSGLFVLAGVGVGYIISNMINKKQNELIQQEIIKQKLTGNQSTNLDNILKVVSETPDIIKGFVSLFKPKTK